MRAPALIAVLLASSGCTGTITPAIVIPIDASTGDAAPADAADAGMDARPAPDALTTDARADASELDAAALDAAAWIPPSTSTACVRPTITSTGEVFDQDIVAAHDSPRLARDEQTGEQVLAYGFMEHGTSSTAMRVQRIAPTLPPVVVGTSTQPSPSIAVAIVRSLIIACWESSGVQCASVDRSGVASPGDSIALAHAPALASRGDRALLAYACASGSCARVLGPDAMSNGSEVALDAALARGTWVAPTSSGFGVLITREDGAIALARVDPSGVAFMSPAVFASAGVTGVARAGAFQDTVVLAYSTAQQISVRAVFADQTSSVETRADADPGAPHGQVAVAGAFGSAAVVWSRGNGTVGYRAIDALGAALGSPALLTTHGGSGDPLDLLATANGFVLAASLGPDGNPVRLDDARCP
jgi:hypothetical protein